MSLQVSVLPGEGPGYALGDYAEKDILGKAGHGDGKHDCPTGIYPRLCRSIQAEGAFVLLKNDLGFHRFLTRGRANVRTEMFFPALAFHLK